MILRCVLRAAKSYESRSSSLISLGTYCEIISHAIRVRPASRNFSSAPVSSPKPSFARPRLSVGKVSNLDAVASLATFFCRRPSSLEREKRYTTSPVATSLKSHKRCNVIGVQLNCPRRMTSSALTKSFCALFPAPTIASFAAASSNKSSVGRKRVPDSPSLRDNKGVSHKRGSLCRGLHALRTQAPEGWG